MDHVETPKAKRKWYEPLLIVMLVAAICGLLGANSYYERINSQQKSLLYQLQILRNALNLYKLVNHTNPTSLTELATGSFEFPGEGVTRPYVLNAPIDKNGQVVDPFGSMYTYDAETGWIRSGTSGYEFW